MYSFEEKYSATKLGGINNAIAAATKRPWASGLTISEGKEKKPYFRPSIILLINDSSLSIDTEVFDEWWCSSWSNWFITIPLNKPDIKAAIGLNKANTGPSIPYVSNKLSTPVCGVETRKETVDPFEAPDSLKVAATGITPHEHKGMGIPSRVDLKTEEKFFDPICFRTNLLSIKIDISPAVSIPRIKYGAISVQRDQISKIYELKYLIILSVMAEYLMKTTSKFIFPLKLSQIQFLIDMWGKKYFQTLHFTVGNNTQYLKVKS